MTLRELSAQYEQSAQLLRERLSVLRRRKKAAQEADERFWLDRRILALSQMLRQTSASMSAFLSSVSSLRISALRAAISARLFSMFMFLPP